MTFADLLFRLSIEHPIGFWVCVIAACSLGPAILIRGRL